MVPDIDLQIQTSLKALSDNVSPALDPKDKIASEQLALVIATLTMVRERLPLQRRFVRRLLEDEIALAEEVGVAVAKEALFTDDIADARAALSDPELDTSELEQIRSILTSRTVMVIREAGADGLAALTPVMLRGAKLPLQRLRAWCIPSGFEPYAADLTTLENLV